jgi:hypothetical protein
MVMEAEVAAAVMTGMMETVTTRLVVNLYNENGMGLIDEEKGDEDVDRLYYEH